MTSGLVSVIVPVFNRPQQLREAVASVLEQDYRPVQIIIVDDGSTDGVTPTTAQELVVGNPGLVQVATQANAGPGQARECGRKLARGEFIQYLDSDDVLLPGKFSAQVAALNAEPQADVAYGITYFRDHTGKCEPKPHKDTGIRKDAMFPSFLNSRWWDTSTPLYRVNVCEKAGEWTHLRLEEDWEYDCRIASLGGRLAYCPVPVSETRDHIGDRICRGHAIDPTRLRQRAAAESLIFRHALAYGLTPDFPEMQQFSRSMFLLARQCGAGGLAEEARSLFVLARLAAGEVRAKGKDFRLYELLAMAFGWVAMGKISRSMDRLRNSDV